MNNQRRKALIAQRKMHGQVTTLVFIELHNNGMSMAELAKAVGIGELSLLNKLLGLADMDVELLAHIFTIFDKTIRIGVSEISIENRGE